MRTLGIIAVCIPMLSACTLNRVSLRAIDQAEARWNAAGIRSYTFDLRVNVQVPSPCAVRDVIAVNVQDLQPVAYGSCSEPPIEEKDQSSIPALFQLMRDAKGKEVPRMRASFDAAKGLPRVIEITYARWVTDATATFYINNFQTSAR